MRGWRWDGSAFAPAQSVPLADRGFRYGMSLFESFRVDEGLPRFLREHLERLHAAAQARGFPVPALGEGAVEQALVGMGTGLARLYLSAGEGGLTAAVGAPGLYLLFENRSAVAPSPLRLALLEELGHPLFGGLKTANYWWNLQALQWAQERGCGEALLFNSRGELVSACCANVFVLHRDRLRTPSTACGARNGVMRAWVMARLQVEETSLTKEETRDADGIFLTNSWIGVQPAVEMEGRALRIPAEILDAVLSRE